MSRFQGRERARGETFIVFRRRRGGVRFGREEIWEAEPANLNSKYQISYPLIFVLVSLDLTSRHVSILRNMLESGRGLSSYHFPDQTLARRVTSKRYSASGGCWPLSKEHLSLQIDEAQSDEHTFARNQSSGLHLLLDNFFNFTASFDHFFFGKYMIMIQFDKCTK